MPPEDGLAAQACALFQRLLDKREGALALLQRYPHHLRDWFVGFGEDQPLLVDHVAELLDHLLLQGNARQGVSTRTPTSSVMYWEATLALV